MSSCLIIAGEKSGEEHALSFFEELKSMNPQTHFYGVGGNELKRSGLELLYHLKDFSTMGFSEVISKLPFYWMALKRIQAEVHQRETKTAILIDFQDFNMLLAKSLRKKGVKVLYYVAPQAWAWKAGRVKSLKQNVHTLFTILPFEKEWFKRRGVEQVISVPHPLMRTFSDDLVNIPEKKFQCWGDKLKILLLPGSRKAEVFSLLPIFIEVVKILKEKLSLQIEIHLVRVSHLNQDFYNLFEDLVDVCYSSDEIAKAMNHCHFSLAASGTVTLTTGLFELPTIVCYSSSLLNEFIFRQFIHYQGPISLTNIIHQKKIFPEFLQEEIIPSRIADQLISWTMNETIYNDLKKSLKLTKTLLAGEDISISSFITGVIHE